MQPRCRKLWPQFRRGRTRWCWSGRAAEARSACCTRRVTRRECRRARFGRSRVDMDIGVDGDRFEHEIGVPYFSRFLREVGLRRMGFHVFGDEAERIAVVFRGATALTTPCAALAFAAFRHLDEERLPSCPLNVMLLKF